MTGTGRVREITNGRFVEAKQENRWLAVRLLWSNPAGRFGSIAGPHQRLLTGNRFLGSDAPKKPEVTGRSQSQTDVGPSMPSVYSVATAVVA